MTNTHSTHRNCTHFLCILRFHCTVYTKWTSSCTSCAMCKYTQLHSASTNLCQALMHLSVMHSEVNFYKPDAMLQHCFTAQVLGFLLQMLQPIFFFYKCTLRTVQEYLVGFPYVHFIMDLFYTNGIFSKSSQVCGFRCTWGEHPTLMQQYGLWRSVVFKDTFNFQPQLHLEFRCTSGCMYYSIHQHEC